jgi:TRAP-type mannitol/chloroaromatic compound transport system permease large subunit
MQLTLLMGLFSLLLVCGVPIAFALAASSLAIIVAYQGFAMIEFVMVPVMFHGIESFLLAAVPLFLVMGMLMDRGGASEVLFNFANSWLRHVPGGLGIATVAICGVFAALCGSSPATAASVGSASLAPMLSPRLSGALHLRPDRGRRDARHPDPAQHQHGGLQRDHRRVGGAAVHRRRGSRFPVRARIRD